MYFYKGGAMVNNKNIDTVIKLIKKEVKKYREPVVEAMNRSSPSPFRVLIGTVLSLRTRDEMTEKAASALFKKAAGPADIAGMNTKTLEKLLYPVGFYRIKAKNIKKISK